MGSVFGKLFVVTTFGESHGAGLGAVIDGCPARLKLSAAEIQAQLDRRRPGQSSLTTQRKEADSVSILSGVQDGLTLGSPIALLIGNTDTRPRDYGKLADIPRPSHADYTYREKYGIIAASGGGRSSARETVGRVAAGAVAEKMLRARFKTEIVAWVSSVGKVVAPDLTGCGLKRADVDANAVRCPDEASAAKMRRVIEKARDEFDSVGGVVTCVCRNVPVGLGEPVFDKANAMLAHAMMSIPAARGFEVGEGFASTLLRGSQHNDMFCRRNGKMGTVTNRCGGIQGGITNGEPVVFRVAFRPTATIGVQQKTVDYKGKSVMLKVSEGRHDPCVLPRAVPIVEAMAALVLADLALLAGVYGQAG